MADWTRVDFAQAAAPVLLPAETDPRPQRTGNKRMGLANCYDQKTNKARAQAAADRRREKQALIKPGGLQCGEHPCTSEVQYSDDETEFMMAVEKYKRDHRRPFPTCRELHRVFLTLGYRKEPAITQGGVIDAQRHEGQDQEKELGLHPAGVRG